MRLLFLVVVLGVAGCGQGVTNCCVDKDSFAVLEATVLDASMSPVALATVRAIGHSVPCTPPQDQGQVAGEGVTDDDGWVRLSLAAGLGAPGRYCVSLVVTPHEQGVAGTVGPYEVEFYSAAPADTTRLTAVIPLS